MFCICAYLNEKSTHTHTLSEMVLVISMHTTREKRMYWCMCELVYVCEFVCVHIIM